MNGKDYMEGFNAATKITESEKEALDTLDEKNEELKTEIAQLKEEKLEWNQRQIKQIRIRDTDIAKLKAQLLASELREAALVEALVKIRKEGKNSSSPSLFTFINILINQALTQSAKPMYEARLEEVGDLLELLELLRPFLNMSPHNSIWRQLALRIEKLEAERDSINEKLGEMG